MSIVTLKKKSLTQYNNMSVGKNQFSLNGTQRIQGFVGQNIISRNLQKTPIKHFGGCCGKYPIGHIVLNGLISTEDINKVKLSTINTNGLLETKYNYKWVKRPFPCSVVKPDNHINLNNQSSYIEILKNNCAYNDKNKIFKSVSSGCNIEHINNKNTHCEYTKDITVNPRKASADQSMYLLRKQVDCSKNNKFFIPHNYNGGPVYKGGGGITIIPNIQNEKIDFVAVTDFPVYAYITFTPIPGYSYSIYNPPIGSQNVYLDGYFIIIGLQSNTYYTFTISVTNTETMSTTYSHTNQIKTPIGGVTDVNGTVFAYPLSSTAVVIFYPATPNITYTLINPPLNSTSETGYPPFSSGIIYIDNLTPGTNYTFTLRKTNTNTSAFIGNITTNMIATRS